MLIKRLPRKKKKKLENIKEYHSKRYKFKMREAIKNGTIILSFENGELRSTFPRSLKDRQKAIPAQKWYALKQKEWQQKAVILQLLWKNKLVI